MSAGIGYMLAGSFASAYYGAPRTTQDIDLVIEATADQLRTFVQLLSKDQYYVDLDAVLEARIASMEEGHFLLLFCEAKARKSKFANSRMISLCRSSRARKAALSYSCGA